jgi:hypothetical protein
LVAFDTPPFMTEVLAKDTIFILQVLDDILLLAQPSSE